MSIQEQNRIIAEFENRFFYGHPISPFGGDTGNALPEMKYHSDWNWLMPAWVKFRNLDLKWPNAQPVYGEWLDSLGWYLYCSDEPSRFCERVAYAIKWYNTLKK